MIDNAVALIAFPDYATEKSGKLFVWDGSKLTDCSFKQVSCLDKAIVTLEYPAIASEMISQGYKMPSSTIDLEDVVVAVSKVPKVSKIRKEFHPGRLLKRFGLSDEEFTDFDKLTYSSANFDANLLKQVGQSMLRAFRVLSRLASIRDEWKRLIEVETPVRAVLSNDILIGIRFDTTKLTEFRQSLEFDYYKALKNFSAKHNLPLEVPSKKDLERILRAKGFDLENVSLDYILDYIGLENNFGEDVRNLQELKWTRDALNGISHKKSTTYPSIISQGTRTSRIILKSPSLQNISKKYRSVLVPPEGKQFSYIDYDQFEVGIMAVLSNDPVLLKLYKTNDLYQNMAQKLFGDKTKRKQAKKLFLSYAYGMKTRNLINAAVGFGSTKSKAKTAFNQFTAFELWKKEVAKEISKFRRIGTTKGNYYHLPHKHKPSDKEIRSGVSQKVQGTGALIFKLALLEISKLPEFRLVLPMHDAVLVEHNPEVDAKAIITVFEKTMATFFKNKIQGKASISKFEIE